MHARACMTAILGGVSPEYLASPWSCVLSLPVPQRAEAQNCSEHVQGFALDFFITLAPTYP